MPVMVFLLGNKLLDRLRSATFAMLGLTTAVGLVLVALVLQQGWPSVFGGPLPGFPNKPPADETASAVPGPSAGGAAPAPQSGVGAAPSRPGSTSGSGVGDSRAGGGSHEVAGSTPIASGPGPAPSEDAPSPPAASPPATGTAPAPAASPPATAAPPATRTDAPVSSAKAGEGNRDSVAAGVESKKSRGKDKVAANGKGRSTSKGSTTSKPKTSASKPKQSSSQPTSVDKANAEPTPSKAAPPAYTPDENEAGTLPVEEKGEHGSGHDKDE